MKTKILLIGGTGYIGTVVSEYFLKIKKNLNFITKYSVEDGIIEIIDFFNKNKKKLKEFNSELYGNYSINLN